MDADPKRPWWRKGRWRLAVAFWLVLPVAYPLAVGPLDYALSRNWVEKSTRNAYHRPVEFLYRTPLGDLYARYLIAWQNAGWRAEGYDVIETSPGTFFVVQKLDGPPAP